MIIWIRDNRYFVELSNGVSFGIDRYGNAYKWNREDQPRGDEHVGRVVFSAHRDYIAEEPAILSVLSSAHVPQRVQELIHAAEESGVAPLPIAA